MLDTVHSTITDELNMQEVYAKPIPKFLTYEQKITRVLIASELKERVKNGRWIVNIWVWPTNEEPEYGMAHLGICSSPIEKLRMSGSKMKTMFTVFFYAKPGCGVQKDFISKTDRQRYSLLRECFAKIKKKNDLRAKRHRRYLAAALCQCHRFHSSPHIRQSPMKHNVAILLQTLYSSASQTGGREICILFKVFFLGLMHLWKKNRNYF